MGTVVARRGADHTRALRRHHPSVLAPRARRLQAARTNDYNPRACQARNAEESAISHLKDQALALPARLMWFVAGLLPSGVAARVGAALLGAVGPQLRKQRQVLRNLHRVLPEASPEELRRVARGVWANLGSVLFEYPHLEEIVRERISVTMPDSVRARLEAGEPMLYLTGHLANWEVLARYLSGRGAGLVVVYSPDDNPVMERLVQRFRAADGSTYVTKQEALRRLTPRFLENRSVGLLPDVRVDSGPSLPLFGSATPTTTSPPRLAARLGYPLVPVRAKRVGPARFDVEFLEPLGAAPGQVGKRAAEELMCRFNRVLESWISERPNEWLCTKRRWPKTPPGP